MVEIQPFKYQKVTNIGEHNQMVDKINEIVDVVNDSGLEGLAGIESRVDGLEGDLSSVSSTVASQGTAISALESDVQSIDSEITGLNGMVVNGVTVNKGTTTGGIAVGVEFEDHTPITKDGTVNLTDVAKASGFALTPSATGVAYSIGVVEGTPKTGNLPVASTTQAGIIKAEDFAKIGEPYELPVASADTLGGVKIGANLSITPEGVLSASGGGGGAGEITSVVVESSDLGLTVGVNGVNSDPEPVAYLDAETMIVGTESPPASGNFVSGIKMGGGFGNDIVIGANVPSVGGSPTLRISGGGYDAITRVDILNVDGLEVKNNSNRLAVGGNNLALASEIPDTSGFLTKTDADADYQPKGSYLTSVPVAGNAIGGVKNGGNVVVDGSGNMNVTIPDVSGFITESEADSKYQPKGRYLTSVPIGGTNIGGVKNGGNVTINADGSMDAEASSLGFNLKYGSESISDFLNTMNNLIFNQFKGMVLTLNFNAYSDDGTLYRCSGTMGILGNEGEDNNYPCNIVGCKFDGTGYDAFVISSLGFETFSIDTADSANWIDLYDTRNKGNSSWYVSYLLAYY